MYVNYIQYVKVSFVAIPNAEWDYNSNDGTVWVKACEDIQVLVYNAYES